MILNDNSGRLPPRCTMIIGWVFAVLTTSLSVVIAGIVGGQRGGTQTLSLIGASLAILIVLGAHLLPALHHALTSLYKALAVPVWMLCMALAIYGHAGFFLYSQQQAGAKRVIDVSPPQELRQPKRGLPAILAEKAEVQKAQARFKAALSKAVKEGCLDNCAELRVRLEGLNGRHAVLAAEAEEVRRLNAAQDALVARQQRASEDLVAFAIRQSLGVPPEQTNLVIAMGIAIVLEMVACLCWGLVLAPRQAVTGLLSQSVVEPVMQVVMEPEASTETPARAGEVTEYEPEVTRVMEAVAGGLMPKPTVEGVRKLLQCGSAKAREVARLVKLRLELPASSPSS